MDEGGIRYREFIFSNINPSGVLITSCTARSAPFTDILQAPERIYAIRSRATFNSIACSGFLYRGIVPQHLPTLVSLPSSRSVPNTYVGSPIRRKGEKRPTARNGQRWFTHGHYCTQYDPPTNEPSLWAPSMAPECGEERRWSVQRGPVHEVHLYLCCPSSITAIIYQKSPRPGDQKELDDHLGAEDNVVAHADQVKLLPYLDA